MASEQSQSSEKDEELGQPKESEEAGAEQPDTGFETLGIDGKSKSNKDDMDEDPMEAGLLRTEDRIAYIRKTKEDNCLFCLDLRTGIIWISVLLPLFMILDMYLFTPWNKGEQWFWWVEWGWVMASPIVAYHGIYGMAYFKMRNLTILQLFLVLMMVEAIYDLMLWIEFFTDSDWYRFDPIFFVFFFMYLGYGTYICTVFINKVNSLRILKHRPMYSAFRVRWPRSIAATPDKSAQLIPQFKNEMDRMVREKVFWVFRCSDPRRWFLILGGFGLCTGFVALILAIVFAPMALVFRGFFYLITVAYTVNGFYRYRASHIAVGYVVYAMHLIIVFDITIRHVIAALICACTLPLAGTVMGIIWIPFNIFMYLDMHQIMQGFNRVHARNGVMLYAPFNIRVPTRWVADNL